MDTGGIVSLIISAAIAARRGAVIAQLAVNTNAPGQVTSTVQPTGQNVSTLTGTGGNERVLAVDPREPLELL